jgi:trk system potassium uptake protein TrkA
MKSYVVIGLGNFGVNVSKTLQENGCEVLGIDSDRDTVQRAKDYVTHAVISDATNKHALKTLGLKDFDGAIVSIGQNLASSILICLYLKEIGVKKIIVRAISEDHEKILRQMEVTEVVFPERDMAERIGKLLSMNNALDYLPLTEDYSILEVSPPEKFVNKTLKELGIGARFGCQVLGIKYLEKPGVGLTTENNASKTKMVPSADDVLTENSVMIVLGKITDIRRMQKG